MPIEVEQKFHVTDRPRLERRLAELPAAQPRASVVQVDCYFAHPSRDFASTDEALRLRRVGELNYITYKGPKLDATTKTRREIEIALPNGEHSAAEAADLLEALGFRRVAEVRKQRVHVALQWQDREVCVSLDEVEGLGSFVELETMASEDDLPAAQACLASLCDRLNLGNGERRSYLELLLAGRS